MLETDRSIGHHREDTLRSEIGNRRVLGNVGCKVEGKHDGLVKSVDASQTCVYPNITRSDCIWKETR
jgi:hypothetical protein